MTRPPRIQTTNRFVPAQDTAMKLVDVYGDDFSVTWSRGDYVVHPTGQSPRRGRVVARYSPSIHGPRRVR